MVTPTLLDHIRHELGCNRRPALVLLVLPRIGEEGYHRGDPACARDLAGVDHDAELHERGVDGCLRGVAARVEDVHVVVPDGLGDPYIGLADLRTCDFGASEGDAESTHTYVRYRCGRSWDNVTHRRETSVASSGWLVPFTRSSQKSRATRLFGSHQRRV
jgi:hypothetical protein